MRTELPVCKRCCCCLPLRYGLITWGYLKLIVGSLASIFLLVTLISKVEMFLLYKSSEYIQHFIILSVIFVLLLTDIALNTVFLVGGHTKNVKLLRVFYIYSMVIWALTVMLVLSLAVMMISRVSHYHIISYYRFWLLLLDFASSFVNIIMQTYFVLLLRSEIIKLSNNCEFRFVNNAGEAECNMNYKEVLLDEEKGSEDISERGTCDSEDVCEKTCRFKGTCHRIADEN